MADAHKVIFVDRDGTINVDYGYVSEIARWKFIEAAPDALRLLKSKGFMLAVVSNQAGVSDGKFSEEAVHHLHGHMSEELRKSGVTLDAVVFCPHGRSGCDCRKPKPGLAKAVENLLGPIDYARSWVIGDKTSDVEFGINIHTRTALIRSRYWEPETLAVRPDIIVESLWEFAQGAN
jgi:D-glycero-D-manno-heptose 1,7-bisphosphate phosphatase